MLNLIKKVLSEIKSKSGTEKDQVNILKPILTVNSTMIFSSCIKTLNHNRCLKLLS